MVIYLPAFLVETESTFLYLEILFTFCYVFGIGRILKGNAKSLNRMRCWFRLQFPRNAAGFLIKFGSVIIRKLVFTPRLSTCLNKELDLFEIPNDRSLGDGCKNLHLHFFIICLRQSFFKSRFYTYVENLKFRSTKWAN